MIQRYIPILLLCNTLHAAEWPVFRGTPEMAGVAEIKLPEKLEIRWTFKCGSSIDGAVAIADGTVFVTSTDKHLYALELTTGQLKWKTELGAPIKASPAFHKGVIYIGNSDGKLFAIKAVDGKVLWSVETNGEITAGVNFHDDNLLVGNHNNSLYCFKANGKQIWEFRIEGPVNGSVAIVGDRTFIAGCDSLLHVVDARTGKSLGNVDLGGQAGATAAVYGESVYVGTMSNQVIAVDWKTIKKQWDFDSVRRQPFYSSAAVTESHVYVGCRDKRLYALDRQTGKEKWNFITAGMVDSSPLVIGSKVYFGTLSNDGHFFVLDAKSGKRLQTIELNRPVTGTPAAGPDCILIGNEKGTLTCLGGKRP